MHSDEATVSGYPSLDGEHYLQLQLLGALRKAVEIGQGRAAVDEILDRLIDFTKVHFNSEQLLMRLYQYPHHEKHVEDHDRTIERLQSLRRAHLVGSRAITLGAAETLSDWILAHILSADRELGHFLVGLGAGPT